jgi:hypothetical protein
MRERLISKIYDAIENGASIEFAMETSGISFVRFSMVPDNIDVNGNVISVFCGREEITFDVTMVYYDEEEVYTCDIENGLVEIYFGY